MLDSDIHQPLDRDESRRLAAALESKPETTIDIHCLNRGLGRAYLLGDPNAFDVAVIEADILPAEPHAYGVNAGKIFELIRDLRGWDCVLVEEEFASPLESLFRQYISPQTRIYEAVLLTLDRPVEEHHDGSVRVFSKADLPLLLDLEDDMRPVGFGTLTETLREGCIAGAMVDDQIVSIGYLVSLTDRYGEIAVHTRDEWRGRGFGTAGCNLVAENLQARGCTPVWSTGADNWASLRVAEKLGFQEHSRPGYVIKKS